MDLTYGPIATNREGIRGAARRLGSLLLVLVALAGTLGGAAPPGKAGSRTLVFDSAALGRSSTVQVWLPDGYLSRGKAWPVAYVLHGEVTPGGPSVAAQLDGIGVESLEGFVVVAPDADDVPACATCVWVDGSVKAESYLLGEVLPLVEQRFNVRSDRASRAVLGTSMGGTGALLQGLRHPDLFGFVGAISPRLDLAGGPSEYDAWLAGQGIVGEIARRNVSPLDLAPQAVAANLEVVVTSAGEDVHANAGPAATLAELGLPHRFVQHDGERFVADAAVLREHVAGPLAATVAEPLPLPHRFSYKTTDRAFSVWGYDFAVQRPNTEFLNVLGARLDGRDLILAGTGSVTVSTPSAFPPGTEQRVVVTPDPRTEDAREPGQKLAPFRQTERVVIADATGRLSFPVQLGAPRPHDELEVALYDGKFEMPHVRVEIGAVDAVPAESTDVPAAPAWREDLPAPFDAWNVAVYPWEQSPQVLTVDFDSPTLGLRARSYVHLPDAYLAEDRPFPVVYFLHGTVDPAGGPGNYQSWNMGFHTPENLARQRYVVVSPDMGEVAWCHHCWWMDALDPPRGTLPWRIAYDPVMAETHLNDELLPLIEAMFRVRADRGGRGVIGNSMGASGAFHLAFRHPDAFGFAGSLSGLHDYASEYWDSTQQTNVSYFARQGYPRRQESPIWYRNISPLDLGPQVVGTDVEFLGSVGDGCIDPLDSENSPFEPIGGTGHCTHDVDPYSMAAEVGTRRDNDHVSPLWAELGVPHTWGRYRGMHYRPDGDVYSTWYIDRINTTFDRGVVDPVRFSYKNVFRSFSVWGYDVSVERPNTEFLNILGARLDGRSFTLAGTGTATVTTPAAFVAHRPYRVRLTDAAGAVSDAVVRANDDGRLVLNVPLGPTRTSDERIELVAAGAFSFPQTHVEVL